MTEYSDIDLLTGGIKYPASNFREEIFIRQYRALVSDYLDLRILGVEPERAFLRCFGTDYYDQFITQRIEALEHNPAYRVEFAKRFGAQSVDQMFNLKVAVYEWLQLINSKATRDSSKVAALKELQVLYGMTVIDANGNTRAGKVLADFYLEQNQAKPLTAPTGELHAEPGSAAAEEFERTPR